MITKKNGGRKIFYVSAACGGALLFLITFMIVRKHMGIESADVTRHVNWALELDYWKELVPFIPYPLFHTLVRVAVSVSALDKVWAAAIVSGGINVLTYVLVLWFLESGLPKEKRRQNGMWGILAFLFLVVQAVYFPAFNDQIYLGQGGINIWHNPTYSVVRPVGIFAFAVVLKILMQKDTEKRIAFTKWWWVLLVGMIVCNLAKPSFSQVFIPGLGLYMIIDMIQTKGKSFAFHFQLACAFVPATILLLWQASVSIGTGVCFSWMEVWHSYTRDPYISILLLLAFPIYVMCIEGKDFFSQIDVKLSCFVCAAGFFEAALLAEEGERKYSGNFFWGYYQGALLVWLVAFRHFLKKAYDTPRIELTRNTRRKMVIGWGIFLMHLISGIYYLYCQIAVVGFWY